MHENRHTQRHVDRQTVVECTKGTYSIHECGRQTHGHIAANMIYGHMDAKTQTYMEEIVRINVTDRQVYWHTDTKKKTERRVQGRVSQTD